MRKKILIIGFCLLIGTIVTVLIVYKKALIKYDLFNKYSLVITVDAKRDDKIISYVIDLSYDSLNARINSNTVNKDTYLIDKKIYYLEADTFYWFDVDKCYIDIYEMISKQNREKVVRTIDDKKFYETKWSIDKSDELLEALFIDEKANDKAKVTYSVKDNKLTEFNIFVPTNESDGYNITVNVTELEQDYKVNTDRIFGSVGGGRRYKIAKTDVNVFEIKP